MIKLEQDFVAPFITGTRETVQKQCRMDMTPGKPFERGLGIECASDITSVIAINAKSYVGSFAMAFPTMTFLQVMRSMFGESFEKVNQDLLDGAGELINMAFGVAKTDLNARGHALELARPQVTHAAALQAKHLTDATVVIVPCRADLLTFQIEFALKKAA